MTAVNQAATSGSPPPPGTCEFFLVFATRKRRRPIHAVRMVYLFDGERFLMAT